MTRAGGTGGDKIYLRSACRAHSSAPSLQQGWKQDNTRNLCVRGIIDVEAVNFWDMLFRQQRHLHQNRHLILICFSMRLFHCDDGAQLTLSIHLLQGYLMLACNAAEPVKPKRRPSTAHQRRGSRNVQSIESGSFGSSPSSCDRGSTTSF